MNRVQVPNPKVYHLSNWNNLNEPQKLDVIKDLCQRHGRDPRIATKAVSILRQSNVKPRDYVGQAACLLRWVQNCIYYVNEPGERLQDPLYTIKEGYGDCDDMAIVLCSFFESINLPWKLVLSGGSKTGKKRYIHGQKFKRDAVYSHIYCMVGNNPFNPTEWYFCEPTIQKVPLGWDVVSANDDTLPELLSPNLKGFGVSPMAVAVGTSVGESTAIGQGNPQDDGYLSRAIKTAISAAFVGVLTTVFSEILLEKIREYKSK